MQKGTPLPEMGGGVVRTSVHRSRSLGICGSGVLGPYTGQFRGQIGVLVDAFFAAARYNPSGRPEEARMYLGYIGLGLVAVLLVVAAVTMLPDLVRYIKISRM